MARDQIIADLVIHGWQLNYDQGYYCVQHPDRFLIVYPGGMICEGRLTLAPEQPWWHISDQTLTDLHKHAMGNL